jgi:hypothetical protein
MKPVSAPPAAGPRARSSRSGFSLFEGIACLVVFALLMGALATGMASLFGSQGPNEVTYSGQVYPQAPSFDQFHDAIELQAAFAQAADAADNVIVLGGTRSHPAYDPTGPSSVLDESFAASSLTAAAGGDGFQAYSSWDQRQLNNAQFAPYLDSNPDPADFTILTVQGLSRLTSITQQRRYPVTIGGRDLSLYEVTCQTIDWSSGSPVLTPNAVTGATPTYAYRFYYPAAEDLWAMPPGATHYWYRADPDWDRDQEGPVRIVFADPYSLAGQDPDSPLSPVSRFITFLPQIR